MSTTELPFRATIAEACAWLEEQTSSPWTLARLLEQELTPYVWLDYDAAHAELFGDANGGYLAPIFVAGDIERLAAGSDDVLITTTKDAHKIVARLPPPGFRRRLDELRFQKKDLERLAGKLEHAAQPAKPVEAKESQLGIRKPEVLAAFAQLARLDLDKELNAAIGIFGDEGARVKASTKRSKRDIVWNPVTLALGLHDVYRVPLGALRRAFKSHDFLQPWARDWEQSLQLLGK